MEARLPEGRSSSATATIRVRKNLPRGPAGSCGRSQKTTPAAPTPSATDSKNPVSRVRRSSLATIKIAARARQAASAAAILGRSLRRLALDLGILVDDDAAGAGDVPGNYLALGFQAEPGGALLVG
jgi:hypothetical protein